MPNKPSSSIQAHIQQTMAKVQLCRELAAAHLEDNKIKMKEACDKRASNAKFVLGNDVWLYWSRLIGPNCLKLHYHCHGPYYLCEQKSKVLFKVCRSSDNKLIKSLVHVNCLKIAWARHLHQHKDNEALRHQAQDELPVEAADLSFHSINTEAPPLSAKPDPSTQDAHTLTLADDPSRTTPTRPDNDDNKTRDPPS